MEMTWPEVREMEIAAVDGRHRTGIDGYKALIGAEDRLYSLVTTDYTLIKHEDTIADMEQELSQHPEFGKWDREIKLYKDGARMRADYRFPDVGMEIQGDHMHPQLTLFNSYDGGLAHKFFWGIFRLVCSNGLVIGHKDAEYRREHHQIRDRQEAQRILAAGLDATTSRLGLWDQWVDKVTTPTEYERVMTSMKFNKTETEEIGQEVEVSSGLKIDDLKTRSLSYWLFFNIVMQYVTHRMTDRKRAVMEQRANRVFYR